MGRTRRAGTGLSFTGVPENQSGLVFQWECKSDMDNAFRFGSVEVICEGYDYPDDPYILKGSCGLEYTIDYTMEGGCLKLHHHFCRL